MELKMDVKELVTKAVEKLTQDKKLQEQFKKEPVKTAEHLLGADLPDSLTEKVVDGIKAKLSLDKASDMIGSLKKLF